jgi:hypothetical protein
MAANYQTADEFSDNFNFFTGDEKKLFELKVAEPLLIRENGHRLFVMGEPGATIFQLLGVILQYNRMVEMLAAQAVTGGLAACHWLRSTASFILANKGAYPIGVEIFGKAKAPLRSDCGSVILPE